MVKEMGLSGETICSLQVKPGLAGVCARNARWQGPPSLAPDRQTSKQSASHL